MGFAYDLQMGGSLIITQTGSRQEQTVSLFAGLELRWDDKAADGAHPAQLNLVAPHLTVGGRERPFDLEPASLPAKFDANQQLLWAQSPTQLRELGMDLTQLLLGLTIPCPHTHLVPGASWSVNAILGDPSGSGRTALKTTYSFVGFEERRRHIYGLIRGSIMLTPQDPPSRHNYVGRVEAYVDPNTGRVVESATSLDIQAKLQLPTATAGVTEEASVRMFLTTYLLDLGPASAKPTTIASSTPTEPIKPEETQTPVISVGQPQVDVEEPEPVVATVPEETDEPEDPIESEEPKLVPTIEITMPSTPPTPVVTTLRKGEVFIDPAGRFSLTLPLGWEAKVHELTPDTTSFAGPRTPQMIYVFVDQAHESNLGNFARSVLKAYAGSSELFQLTSDLQPISMGQVPAFMAHYAYPQAGTDQMVEELAFFARYLGYDYILQITDAPERLAEQKAELADYFTSALRFGPTPGATVPVSFLTSAGNSIYTDGRRRYSMEVPNLWPLFFKSDDDSSVTFAELGKNGYLTVYAQSGMERHTPDSVLRSWRGQWSRQEQGFRELTGIEPARLSGFSGATMSYEWLNTDGRLWQRRVAATIQRGTLYAVVIDYVSSGAPERALVFSQIINSFRISSTAPIAGPPSPPQETTTPAEPPRIEEDDQPAPTTEGVVTGAGRLSLASQVRLEEPLSSSRVLLIGRLGERVGSEIQWLSGITIRVRSGQSMYATRTDANGYFAFANIAPLAVGSSYSLLSVEGPMFGYSETVNVAFSGVQVPSEGHLLVNSGHVVMELVNGETLKVTQVLPSSLSDPQELPRYFLENYAESGWSSVLRSAMSRP